MSDRLQQLLPGLEHPVVQAPMAGVSTPALAAAVSARGALGALALGALDATAARQALRAMRAATRRPVLYNLFAHPPADVDTAAEQRWLERLTPYFAELEASPPSALTTPYASSRESDALVAELVAARVAVVSFHFGLPTAAQHRALTQAGIRVWATATSVAEIEAVDAAGLDAVVLQGAEAGGHRGDFLAAGEPMATVDELLAAARQRCSLPLVAAGGLMDGADVARVLELGASAAMLGTAFVPCPESSASDAHRDAFTGASTRTAYTRAISGRAARGFVTRWHEAELQDDVPAYPRCYSAGKALAAAASAAGDGSWAVHWAGSGAARARALPAADLIDALLGELDAAR